MHDFIVTKDARRALAMCRAVMAARPYNRLGQIIGVPGSGKSAVTSWLAEELGGVRVECWSRMNAKALLQEIGEGFNEKYRADIALSTTSNTLFARLREYVSPQRVILVDEANHLRWPELEKLRGLSDLGGAPVILCGTDLLSRQFRDGRVNVYLQQLAQRIGAKRVDMHKLRTAEEVSEYIIGPRFGAVPKKVAHRFQMTCRGNWRAGLELADACERLMKAESALALDTGIVEAASGYLSGVITTTKSIKED